MTTLRTITDRLEEAQLPIPPIPTEFVDQIEEFDDWVYGSRDPSFTLLDLAAHEAHAIEYPHERFLYFGHAGYGTNTWFFHYYLATPEVAIFVQEPWGGAFTDQEIATGQLRRRYQEVELLLEAVRTQSGNGTQLPGRLIVECSSYLNRRWGWCVPGEPVSWTESDDPLSAARSAVTSL